MRNPKCLECGGATYQKMNIGDIVFACFECGHRFSPDARRDGYHCDDCAATAGYGTFHFDSLAEQRRRHQEEHGWGDREVVSDD